MSDMFAIFGLLLILGLGLLGLLITWWLLFPGRVMTARNRVARTPWKTFFTGLAGLGLWSAPSVILLSLPAGPAKMLGAAGVISALAFATLGAAGITSLISSRLSAHSSPELSPAASYLRGALAFELAVVVPVLGWFFFLPIALIFSMGAAIFALLGWAPRPVMKTASATQTEAQAV